MLDPVSLSGCYPVQCSTYLHHFCHFEDFLRAGGVSIRVSVSACTPAFFIIYPQRLHLCCI